MQEGWRRREGRKEEEEEEESMPECWFVPQCEWSGGDCDGGDWAAACPSPVLS